MKKRGAKYQRMFCVGAVIIAIIVTIALSLLPFENLFVTFDSPDKAYEYYFLGKSNIELTVEGNECDLVVNRKDYTYTLLIVPKTDDGWKIGIGSDTKIIDRSITPDINICVYQYKNTSDYFIVIHAVNGRELIISDENKTEFYSSERYDDYLDQNFVTYFAHIDSFDSHHSLTVDGELIILGSE